MSLANQVDDRTVAEQLRDLGVPIERPNAMDLTGVKWVAPAGAHSTSSLIRVTRRGVYMLTPIAEDLQWKVSLGTGKLRGQTVLLIRHDPRGYKPNVPGGRDGYKSRRPYVGSRRVLSELFTAGLKEGLYEPRKAKGGWVGVPV